MKTYKNMWKRESTQWERICSASTNAYRFHWIEEKKPCSSDFYVLKRKLRDLREGRIYIFGYVLNLKLWFPKQGEFNDAKIMELNLWVQEKKN